MKRTSGSSAWDFVGRGGKPWSSQLTIAPAGGGDRQYTATLRLAEAS